MLNIFFTILPLFVLTSLHAQKQKPVRVNIRIEESSSHSITPAMVCITGEDGKVRVPPHGEILDSPSATKVFYSGINYKKEMNDNNASTQKKLVVKIVDEKGKPTAARVRVTGKDSAYYAPVGHKVDFPITEDEGDIGKGGDVMLDNNRRFAYVEDTFQVMVPQNDSIMIELVKGYVYRFFDTTLAVSGSTDTVTIQLHKWFHFPAGQEWYSGDVHTHQIDSATALLEMKAEDVNVCNILISDFTDDQASFRGAPEPISDSLHIVYLNQEYRQDQLGHINLLNLKKLIEPVKLIRKYQYPLNIDAMDKAHAQGGHVSWAHFAAYPALEAPLAIVLKKVDAVELLCTIDPFNQPIFVSDVVPDLRMNSGLRLWYRLLNCGLKIPASAGTDKMNNWVTVGGNRVYASIKGPFNYQSWIDALDKGNTFITNSPMLFCTVDGKTAGEEIKTGKKKKVKIVAEVFSQLPLDRLEIIAGGEMIAQKIIEKGEYHAKLEIEYNAGKSTWIAARTHMYNQKDMIKGVSFAKRRDVGGGPTQLNRYYGTLRPETPFAHTGPVYISVEGKPIRSAEDARYFIRYLQNAINWLQKSGSFPSAAAKQEVLTAFQNGIEGYRKLETDAAHAQSFATKKTKEGIGIYEKGKPVLFFQVKPKTVGGKYERSGFVHPLYDMNGRVLTDDSPKDHPYHRGIFWAWHQVIVNNRRIGDGWMSDNIYYHPVKSEVKNNKGSLVLTSLMTWNAKMNDKNRAVVKQKTVVTVYPSTPHYRILDFSVMLTPLAGDLKLGGSEDPKGYGGFNIRLKLPKDIAFVSGNRNVTPEETAVNAGPWMDITGSFQGDSLPRSGVAVFGYRHVHQNNPWILRSVTSMQNIPYPGRVAKHVPKEGWRLHYRLVVHDDSVTSETIEKLYKEWAK